MNDPRIEAQIEQLNTPIDRLWWFAQLERGVEVAAIDREPQYGSKKVIDRMVNVYWTENPPRPRGHDTYRR